MCHQNCLRALFAEVIDRRQTFTDPGVVGDRDVRLTDPVRRRIDERIESASGESGEERALRNELRVGTLGSRSWRCDKGDDKR